MSPFRLVVIAVSALSATALGSCRQPESDAPRTSIAKLSAPDAAVVEARGEVTREHAWAEAPLAGRVVTDTNDVAACLPLEGGRTLAATAGGLWLVGAHGETLALLTALDGLPETRALALHRSGDRVFVGTDAGVAAVRVGADRLRVERTAKTASARALLVHDGKLFAATWGGGVVRMPLDLAGAPKKIASSDERFTSLALAGGTLFAGGQKGLFRLERNALAAVRASELPAPIFALAPAAEGDELWVGGLVGLARHSSHRTQIESGADVRSIARSSSGVLVGTFGQGAFAFDGKRLARVEGVGSAFVQSVGEANGARCIGTRDGLFVAPNAGESFHAVKAPNLPSNDVSAVAMDGERVWIGTFDRGLALLSKGRIEKVSGVDDRVNAIAVGRDGTANVATARGLARVATVEGSPHAARFSTDDGLPSNDVHAVAPLASGALLAGTGAGAAIVEHDVVTPIAEKAGIPRGAVWAVAEGPRGLLVLGTSRGLLLGTEERTGVLARTDPHAEPLFAAPTWIQVSMATGDLDDDWVTAIAVSGNSIYVGTYNAGVTRLDLDAGGAMRSSKIGDGYVNFGALAFVGERLYVGTMGGLFSTTGSAASFARVDRAAPGVDVTAIAKADAGGWVASRRGLAFVSL